MKALLRDIQSDINSINLDEGLGKLIHTVKDKNNVVTAKVYFDKEWEEFISYPIRNGKVDKKGSYHTSDKKDAIDTAKLFGENINESSKTSKLDLFDVNPNTIKKIEQKYGVFKHKIISEGSLGWPQVFFNGDNDYNNSKGIFENKNLNEAKNGFAIVASESDIRFGYYKQIKAENKNSMMEFAVLDNDSNVLYSFGNDVSKFEKAIEAFGLKSNTDLKLV